MRKSLSVTIAIIVVIAVVAIAVLVTRSRPSGTTNSTGQPATTSSNNTDSTHATVNIRDMMFTPSQITVAKGGTVTWTNNDTLTHTVVIDHGPGPNSGDIKPGSTYSYTFNQSGSYQYHCSIHPSMRGTIVVQ